MKINFHKYQGAGNDFIIIDKIKEPTLVLEAAAISKKICDRHYGVGADGLVVLSKDKEQIIWDFYNSDGSFAAMCGNAARCVGKHLFKHHHLEVANVLTGAGSVFVRKQGELYAVEMPKYKDLTEIEENVTFVNTGVPHFVVSVHKDEDVFSYIKEYRWHSVAGEHGSNVSFYYADGDHYKAKTFERGVEGFTLACGTGAAACGLIISLQTKKTLIPIEMPGGKLSVKVEGENIYLIGSAEAICQGEFYV
jgi:diaminopimelate epimerase